MKGGVTTFYLGDVVPIEIHWIWHPEERTSWDCPGERAHIEIEQIKFPTFDVMVGITNGCIDEILEACREDMEP